MCAMCSHTATRLRSQCGHKIFIFGAIRLSRVCDLMYSPMMLLMVMARHSRDVQQIWHHSFRCLVRIFCEDALRSRRKYFQSEFMDGNVNNTHALCRWFGRMTRNCFHTSTFRRGALVFCSTLCILHVNAIRPTVRPTCTYRDEKRCNA